MTENQFVFADARGTYTLSFPAMLAKEGTLFLTGEITSETSAALIQAMLYLTRKKIPVRIVIDSPGGGVRAGMAIADMMELCSKINPVSVYCSGRAYSMAAVILACGAKGHRFLFPHAEVMIHEPLISHGAGGSASSVQNTAESLLATRDMLSGVLARCTGKTVEEINQAISRDNYFNAQDAIAFGLADEVAQTL